MRTEIFVAYTTLKLFAINAMYTVVGILINKSPHLRNGWHELKLISTTRQAPILRRVWITLSVFIMLFASSGRSLVLANETPDTSAPVLKWLAFSSSNVYTNAANPSDLQISVTLIVEDRNSVTSGALYLENVTSAERLQLTQTGSWEQAGLRHTGVFTVMVNATTQPGMWFLSSLVLSDSVNNTSTRYDTLEELVKAQFAPVVSLTASFADTVFDASIQASPSFSQSGETQKSFLNITLQDAVSYDIWFVPYIATNFSQIIFSSAISIAQTCTNFEGFTKCSVTASNNNAPILATVDTRTNDINSFGYSVLVQPTGSGRELQWHDNYLEFPRIDLDNDGIPNEQDSDDDNDSVPDIVDLFPLDASEWLDFDNDGVGNNADTDDDNDGVDDTFDAFPFDASENNDHDNDGLGDVIDNDDDNDGVLDTLDAFPLDPRESLDTDGDGIGNNADNDDDNDGGTDDNDAFPLDPTETIDSDGDGIGNNADTDDDNDGILDVDDAFTRDPTESIDTDRDGIGNNADNDDDNDGILDVDDLFPLDAGDFRDNDLDGIGDNADTDDDNDGILDVDDAFPFNANETRDSDNDGIGNNLDPDDDNDGLDDEFDQFPFDPTEVADFDGDGIGNNADTDDDNDGVLDVVDAFVFAVTEWFDTDNDGIGDNADPDNDNDGVDDEFDAFDNDPTETIDTDGDFIGNNRDTDDDNDGVLDINDAFPLDASESLDTDRDGLGNNKDVDDDGDRVVDAADLFPLDPMEYADNDLDGIGNNGDLDDDNDGVLDIDDAFPFDASESLDFDGDNIGDNADIDDDNDGFVDLNDVFPFDATEWADNDADGLGDNRDSDDDNDGMLDIHDAFPFDATETLDNDRDGIGNNADNDDDNDGVLDDVDAFPFSAAESLDSDGDGIGNNADQDDDNDGIVDADDSQPLNPSIGDDQAPTLDGLSDLLIEATGPGTSVDLALPRVRDNNLNAATVSSNYSGPLAVGEHVITWTAVDFAGNVSTLAQKVTIQDTAAPTFDSANEITIAARGIFTDVSQDINEKATDIVDGRISTRLITENNLKAGSQMVMLQATDAAGNFAISEFFVNILPTLTARSRGYTAPGNSLALPVVLSGKAPAYPVRVDYTIVGPVTSARTGVLEILQGQQGALNIDVAATARLGEQIWVSFANPQNASITDFSQIQLEVSIANRAPVADIKLLQNNEVVSVAYQNSGNVTLLANITDINLDDSHQVVWQIAHAGDTANSIELTNISNNSNSAQFVFNPSVLVAGEYIARAAISERNTAQQYSSVIEFAFAIKSAALALSPLIDSDFDGLPDELEGVIDSDLDGIADYLDDDSNTASLPTGVSEQGITTEAGYRLTLGDIAKLSNAGGAANAAVSVFDLQRFGLLTQYPEVQIDDPHFNPIQEILNFNIENLNAPGESVAVVIPLNTGSVIPINAVYRKFNSRDGWFTFVQNAHNGILSAPFDADGNCPKPDSALYITGLVEGDTCIQLIIQDGGPNDADLQANGIIKDPGVLAMRLPNRSPLISVAQQTTVLEGETVRVDASLTSDPEGDNLLYTWTQIGGPRIALDENVSPLLSFTSPMVNENEILLFRLDVYDGRDTSSTTLRVTIRNRNSTPTVVLEPHNTQVGEGEQITLSAVASDGDGDFLHFEWRQLSGPAVALVNKNNQSLSLTLPEVSNNQEITLAIFVSDSEKQVSASTTITVVDKPVITAPSGADESGGGAINLFLLFIVGIVAFIRRPFTVRYSPHIK